MKFRFQEISQFNAEVTVVLPGGAEQVFTGIFRYLDDKDVEVNLKKSNVEFLREIWIGWDGIIGPDDQPLTYDADMREQMLRHTYIHSAVLMAFVNGRLGLRTKN